MAIKKDNKKRLFEIMQRVVPEFQNEGVNLNTIYGPQEYKKKVEELKAQIDKLFSEEEFEDIDTLYRLLVKRVKPITSPEELKEIFDKLGRHGQQ
jgi:hypothetical protein